MRLLATLLALCLVLAACGSDGSDPARDELTSAIAGALVAEAQEDVGPEEANCIADLVVEEVGMVPLAELGVTAESPEIDAEAVDEDLQQAAVAALMACIDARGLVIDGMVSEAGTTVSEQSTECVREGMSDELVERFMTAVVRGDPPQDSQLSAELIQLAMDCLSPEEFEQLMGEDDESGQQDPLVAAIAEGILADPPEGVGEDEANCMAEELVEAVGVEGLIELGVTVDAAPGLDPATLDPDLQEATADVMIACTDLRGAFIEGLGEASLSGESTRCVGDAISDDQLRELALLGIRDQPVEESPIFGELIQVVVGCLTPEELQQLGE